MEPRQAVAQQYVNVLGRQASPFEIDNLSKFIEDGHLNPEEVGQIIQSFPEYQNTLLQKNGQQYSDLLAANDARTLGQAAQTGNAALAGLGRQGSSALDMGIASQAGNLAAQRQNAIAAFYGKGLQNNMGLSQMYGQNALARGYGLRDESRQRNYQIEDYYRQQNDYNNALPGQATRNLQGKLTGIALNAGQNFLGGMMGQGAQQAMAASGGSGLGGLFAGGLAGLSDIRAKKNIVRVGVVGPLNVYAFDYRDDIGVDLPKARQIGFMAHEVEAHYPEAVGNAGGFKTVNYSYLGGVL